MRKDYSKFFAEAQRASVQRTATEKSASKSAPRVPFNWNEWNPFERATGEALKQLNQRQRKQTEIDGEEALL